VNGRVSFGEFVLDADTRELRRGSKSVPLSPKAYELLETLVANRPKALSKIVLQETLWPGTFVVEKNVVNLVAEIREALGDDATHPRFIRTVHRFGYSFREAPADDGPLGAPQVRFRLIWSSGRAGLGEGEHVLGRDPDLRLFLDAPGVSRRHAVIRVVGEQATVEDLGSKNGTFIAEQRLDAPRQLADGDVITIGSVALTITTLREWGSTHTEPHPKS
jgi:DNA-binding winged helix-turn-helix (wHTH) protein